MKEPVTIQHANGSLEFTEEQIEEALGLEGELFRVLQFGVIETGRLLHTIKENNYHLVLYAGAHKMLTSKAGFKVMDTPDAAFHVWVEQSIGMSKSSAYRYINIYAHLFLRFPELFGADQRLKLPLARLDYLSSRGRHESDQIEEAIEMALSLDALEWEAYKAETFLQMSPESAQDRAESIIKQRRELLGQIEPDRPSKWISKHFRRFVSTLPCVITRKDKYGEIHPAHLRSKGAILDDFCNVVPLHHSVHGLQHDKGWDAVYEKYNTSEDQLRSQAVSVTVKYLEHLESEVENE